MEIQLTETPEGRKPLEHQAFERVDSRICSRCGARAGHCDHLKADTDVVWLSRTNERTAYATLGWFEDEKQRLRDLCAAGYSNAQIAEIMNKTEGAIAGQIYRLGARR
jgi:hypothetical protein